MKSFTINHILDSEDNPFDRHSRMSWWSQSKVSNAKVMVVGAGAIGNETLKNLALLGIKNIFIVDFDEITTSNLSRTVLFRKTDTGKKKAKVAATRTKELCLASNPNIDWFHGDIVWDLGSGVYREMDLILGCLDNVETRFHVNKQCWLSQTPWIDSGIYELGLHVNVFVPPNPPCYQCSATDEQLKAKMKRYSCDQFKRAMVTEGKVPTVQIASAIASAIQVQEAMKLICDQQVTLGSKIYYQGKINDFDLITQPINHDCTVHTLSYRNVITTPLSADIKLVELLQFISDKFYSGDDISLCLTDGREFILSVSCRSCDNTIDFYKPNFRIYDTDLICSECLPKALEWNSNLPAQKSTLSKFSLKETKRKILNMSLFDIGIPLFHVIEIEDNKGHHKYFELSGDKSKVLSNFHSTQK